MGMCPVFPWGLSGGVRGILIMGVSLKSIRVLIFALMRGDIQNKDPSCKPWPVIHTLWQQINNLGIAIMPWLVFFFNCM